MNKEKIKQDLSLIKIQVDAILKNIQDDADYKPNHSIDVLYAQVRDLKQSITPAKIKYFDHFTK